MSLRSKVKEELYQKHALTLGRIPVHGLRGLIQAIENLQGNGVKVPDIQIASLTLVDSNVDVDASGVGRLYGAWIVGGTALSRVWFTDNNITIAQTTVPSGGYAEVYFYGGADGVGIPYATDLEVDAKLADNSTPAATTVRPTVVVLWGDSLINTDDANLPSASYG